MTKPDFSGDKMVQKCTACPAVFACTPRDSLIKSGAFSGASSEGMVHDTQLKYKTLIRNTVEDRAANVVEIPCPKCKFPVMHQIRIGPNAMIFSVCPKCKHTSG